MKNYYKVKKGDVLVSNVTDIAWYVEHISGNGNMTIYSLSNHESKRVSKTFANSCMIFREID